MNKDPRTPMAKLATRLDLHLRMNHIRKADFALAAGISRPCLDSILRGNERTAICTLEKVAVAMDRDLWELLR